MKTNLYYCNILVTFLTIIVSFFSVQFTQAQCPTVSNNVITTCAFDGTTITTINDLETLAGVSGTTSTIAWYDMPTGGTIYNGTDSLTDGIYYLDTTTNECTPRIAVTVTVNGEQPTCIDGDCDGDFFCESSMATVQDIIDEFSGTNLEVSLTPGGTALTTTDLLVSSVYWVTQTEAGCTSNPLPYNVIIQQVTPPTVVDPFPFFCQPPVPTVADLAGTVTGSVGFWYADASLSVVLPNTTPLIDGEDYFTYALFGTCRSENVSITVTIGDMPEAGTPTSMQFCDDGDISDQALADYGITDMTNVDLLNFLTGQDAGGIWTDDNTTGEITSGTDTTINLNNVYNLYLAGTITQACYTYTVTNTYTLPDGSTDTCEDTATVCINFDPILVAGTATGPLEICETDLPSHPPVNLFDLLTGEDLGGTWTDDSGSCVSLVDPTAVNVSCLTPGSYTYTYTVNQTTSCPPESETVTITITDAPDLVINSPENFCITDNTATTVDLFTYLTTDSSGGAGTWTDTNGTGALTLPSTVDITILQGLGDGSYTFNYEVDNGAGCINDINMVIIIDPENQAGNALPSAVICETNLGANSPFDLFTLLTGNDVGGTWTDDDGTGALTGNLVDLTAIATPYNPTGYDFTYTASNASCPDDTETVTIIITEVPEAGTSGNQSICITATSPTSVDLFTIITGEDPGGIWTDTNGTGALTLPSTVNITTLQALGAGNYSFEYSIDNGDGCVDTATAIIIIEPVPDPVNITITDICKVDLVAGTNPFANLDDLVTAPNNATDVDWAIVAPTPGIVLIDPLTGQIDWAAVIANAPDGTSTTFTFQATSNTAVDCDPDLGQVSFTVVDIAAPTGPATLTRCEVYTVADLITEYTSPGNNIIVYDALVGGSLIDPTTVIPIGTNTYYITAQDPASGCESNPRTEVTITINPNSFAGDDGATNICTTSTTTINLFDFLANTPDNGGTWTGPIATTNGDQGTIDPSLLADGVHIFTYTVAGLSPCPDDTATVTITIDPLPNGGTNGPDQNLCSTDAPIDLYTLLGGTPDGGGTWSPALTSGTDIFDPAIDTPGIYTYTVTNACGTATPAAQITINVTLTPVINNPGDQQACDSFDLTSLAITGTNLTGNQNYYSAPNGGGSILTTINTPGATTVYIYDVTSPTVCSDEESFTVTIISSPVINSITPADVCDSFTFPAITGTNLSGNEAYYDAPNGGGTQYTAGAIFTPTNAGTFTFYIYDETGTTPNCFNEVQFDITINQTPNAGIDNALTTCISDAQFNMLGQLGGTPNTTGNWYLSTDLTTIVGDNTLDFNPATDFPNTTNGTSVSYTYIITAVSPCTDQQATLTITLSNPGLPTVADQTFCESDNPTVADLVVNGVGGFQWYDNENDTTPLNMTDTLIDGEDYWVSQDNGCESLKVQANITINDPGTPTLITDGHLFCINDNPTLNDLTANIENPDGHIIAWYDTATGGNVYADGTLILTHGQTYYATFIDSIPCDSAIRLEVTVDLTDCDDIIIPDAFSPNGDGQNDTYTIQNIDLLYPNHTIEISNRYGNVVYKGDRNTIDFDGKSNQSKFMSEDILPTGVYFYIIEFNDGVRKPKQGRLYLSR